MTTPKQSQAPRNAPKEIELAEEERIDVIAKTRSDLEKLKIALPDRKTA